MNTNVCNINLVNCIKQDLTLQMGIIKLLFGVSVIMYSFSHFICHSIHAANLTDK